MTNLYLKYTSPVFAPPDSGVTYHGFSWTRSHGCRFVPVSSFVICCHFVLLCFGALRYPILFHHLYLLSLVIVISRRRRHNQNSPSPPSIIVTYYCLRHHLVYVSTSSVSSSLLLSSHHHHLSSSSLISTSPPSLITTSPPSLIILIFHFKSHINIIITSLIPPTVVSHGPLAAPIESYDSTYMITVSTGRQLGSQMKIQHVR